VLKLRVLVAEFVTGTLQFTDQFLRTLSTSKEFQNIKFIRYNLKSSQIAMYVTTKEVVITVILLPRVLHTPKIAVFTDRTSRFSQTECRDFHRPNAAVFTDRTSRFLQTKSRYFHRRNFADSQTKRRGFHRPNVAIFTDRTPRFSQTVRRGFYRRKVAIFTDEISRIHRPKVAVFNDRMPWSSA
jgi:hypothetical protein